MWDREASGGARGRCVCECVCVCVCVFSRGAGRGGGREGKGLARPRPRSLEGQTVGVGPARAPSRPSLRHPPARRRRIPAHPANRPPAWPTTQSTGLARGSAGRAGAGSPNSWRQGGGGARRAAGGSQFPLACSAKGTRARVCAPSRCCVLRAWRRRRPAPGPAPVRPHGRTGRLPVLSERRGQGLPHRWPGRGRCAHGGRAAAPRHRRRHRRPAAAALTCARSSHLESGSS